MTFKTYQFAEKNGDATLTLSEENEDDAINRLKIIAVNPMGWRLCEVMEE